MYFSIINVFWLLNLCGAGGDPSFAPSGKSSWYKFINKLAHTNSFLIEMAKDTYK